MSDFDNIRVEEITGAEFRSMLKSVASKGSALFEIDSHPVLLFFITFKDDVTGAEQVVLLEKMSVFSLFTGAGQFLHGEVHADEGNEKEGEDRG